MKLRTFPIPYWRKIVIALCIWNDIHTFSYATPFKHWKLSNIDKNMSFLWDMVGINRRTVSLDNLRSIAKKYEQYKFHANLNDAWTMKYDFMPTRLFFWHCRKSFKKAFIFIALPLTSMSQNAIALQCLIWSSLGPWSPVSKSDTSRAQKTTWPFRWSARLPVLLAKVKKGFYLARPSYPYHTTLYSKVKLSFVQR